MRRPPQVVPGEQRQWRVGSWAELSRTMAQVRTWVYDDLAAPCAVQVVDRLVLVLIELMDNAMRHVGPPVLLRIDADGDQWLLSIADRSMRPPPRSAGLGGLTLVLALADAVGWSQAPPGKVVWAVLLTAAPGTGAETGPGERPPATRGPFAGL